MDHSMYESKCHGDLKLLKFFMLTKTSLYDILLLKLTEMFIFAKIHSHGNQHLIYTLYQCVLHTWKL